MKTLQRLYHGLSRFDTQLADWGGSLLSLAIRLHVGWQFMKSGMVKASSWENTVALFQHEYSVPVLPPELAAAMGMGGELLLPPLLFAGLLSRPAALGLFAVNAMALLSYPQLWQFECPAAVNDHLFWGVLLLVVVAFGPGRFSLDRLLSRPDRNNAGR